MGGFNVNQSPGFGPAAIPWLKQGLKSLWRRVDSTGSATGRVFASDDTKIFPITFEMTSIALGHDHPMFTITAGDLVVTGMQVMFLSATVNPGPPLTLPIVSIGWDDGTGSSYEQILSDNAIAPSRFGFTVDYDITPTNNVPVIPNGTVVKLNVTQRAGAGYSSFYARFFVSGFYK